MIKTSFLSLFAVSLVMGINQSALAESWRSQTRGYLSGRLTSYTKESSQNYGQQARAQLEQATDFRTNLSALNQLRWTSNSINADLNNGATLPKKETFDTYLGENYLKIKSDSWVAQLGYQEVVWGEAFGFNYADIINPKDLRETLYSDAGDARLPLLLFNGKTFFSKDDFTGSLQFLYSPEPRFSKTLPVEIYAGNLFPGTALNVNKEKTPKIFKNTDMGGKFSGSFRGFDFSLFNFSYLDRDPHYILQSATSGSITLNEVHTKIDSSGISLAKTIYDFVLRTDIIRTKDKRVNYLENSQLKSFSTNSLNALVSIDSPTYNDYSGVLIFAQSTLKDIMLNSFRDKKEQYLIGKISKNLSSDKSLEFSYTHEFEHTGHSIQSFINWPVNNTTVLKLGGQFYFGNDSSNLNKYKNISSLFFSVKNYFQF